MHDTRIKKFSPRCIFRPQMGRRELVTGPASFFLAPGEALENGTEAVHILGGNQGLILKACELFGERKPGEKWPVKHTLTWIVPRTIRMVLNI